MHVYYFFILHRWFSKTHNPPRGGLPERAAISALITCPGTGATYVSVGVERISRALEPRGDSEKEGRRPPNVCITRQISIDEEDDLARTPRFEIWNRASAASRP